MILAVRVLCGCGNLDEVKVTAAILGCDILDIILTHTSGYARTWLVLKRLTCRHAFRTPRTRPTGRW